jgi:transposase
MKHDDSARTRSRAHSILLSAQGKRINEIASIYHVDRDTVSAWLTAWEQRGMEGLYDQPRSGRPAKLTPEEQELALGYLKEDPRGFKRVAARLLTETGKRVSLSVLKRLAKKARLRWKRVRKSLKDKRDPEAFAHGQRELWALQEQHKRGEIGLYYFDEAGFALDPCLPYAWQQEGEVIEVPAWQRGRVNVLGFMNTDNDLHPFLFEESVNSAVVVACFDVFCQTIEQKTVVVMDNASIHRSDEFESNLPRWKNKGLLIKFLPEYSPELNLIEILWRKIKYEWLPFSAYYGLSAMIEALEDILRKFGAEYQITFA